jgi:F-type H+-transporting ATPase subunit b
LELNWSTFVLEVINFLVLVWILKRFLYQPVLNVIADRRKVIEGRLEEARATQQEATALKAQYEGRLVDWETERRKARDALAQEIERERAHRLADLQAALESEREKARAADDRAEKERRRAVEIQALQQAATFSTRLLEQASGPELEARLINMLIDELRALPADEREGLRTRQQNGLNKIGQGDHDHQRTAQHCSDE